MEGVLPLFEGGRAPTGIPGGGEAEPSPAASRQKIFVDWTLCRGHGLCADILPEVFELGADGFPTVAQAQVPRYAEAKALRAVRRCPALALRIEEDTRAPAPSRNLPVLSQGRGRRALARAEAAAAEAVPRPSARRDRRRVRPAAGPVPAQRRRRAIRSDDPPSTLCGAKEN